MIGEFFGATHDFEYNIGDKLYEFAIMSYEYFDKLKTMYTGLIELVCSAKEANIMDEKDFLNDMKGSFKHKFAKKPEVIEGNMKALEMALNEVKKIN